MSNSTTTLQQFESAADLATPEKKKKRVFMWFFLAVQALFIVWIVTGISSVAGSAGDPVSGLTAEEATAAAQIGGGIGVMLIVGVWFAVDFFLGLGYLIKVLATKNR